LELAEEAIALDAILGLELMEDTVRWAHYTRAHSSRLEKTFTNFFEFKFSCAARLTPEDVLLFKSLNKLYIRHYVYINDLYLYKQRTTALPFSNAVHVVEQFLGLLSSNIAIIILRSIIFEAGRQVLKEYNRLRALRGFNEMQQYCLQRIIESMAGSVMYHSTTCRYARFTGALLGL
jgi:hypothetical protein